jgi:diguanylate cyclase
LSDSIRAHDTACRYGGEEFALILPDTDAAAAAQLCERIRITAAALEFPRHPALRVTASFGVTDQPFQASHAQPRAWIEAADRALYDAKQAGRDRVHLYDAATGGGAAALRLAV